MSGPSAFPSFDPRALTEPVDRGAARAYVRRLKAEGRMPRTSPVAIVVAAVVGGIFVMVFGTTFVGIAGAFLAVGSSSGASPLFALIPGVILVVFLAIAGLAVWGFVSGRLGGGGARAFRLDRFARANGMAWYPQAQNPPLPGLIFGVGHDRVATDIVRGTQPRLVEFANYRYESGSGKNERTHAWGYVAVKLAAPLPHIVLDATGNNGLFGSNLPASFDRHQRLHLEGDFDRYFALFCPEGYERDALYLFTPDIMSRFIDNAAALDVEIVDDWLLLYTQRDVSTLDPATWAWLFSVVGALLDKLAQWERWRDDRVTPTLPLPFTPPAGEVGQPAVLTPPPGVAPAGRRLARGVPWGAIAVFGVISIVFVLGQLGVFGSILGSIFGSILR